MNVKAETRGHALILNCKGELNVDALEVFQRDVQKYLTRDMTDVVLNLTEVPFVDSAGLTYLLDLQDKLAEKLGQVLLVGLDQNLDKVLEITRLDGAFQMHGDVSDAVRAL